MTKGFARTAEEARKECEKLFQNGGPKAYFWDQNTMEVLPSLASSVRFATILARLDDNGTIVFARRKVRGQRAYEWKEIKP